MRKLKKEERGNRRTNDRESEERKQMDGKKEEIEAKVPLLTTLLATKL